MKMYDLTYEDKCPLNNKELVYKILENGYLDLVIKLEISDEDDQTKKEFLKNQDQYECFKSIIELKMFEIQNKIKKNKDLIKYLFNATDEELDKISYEKSENKIKFFYKRYNQEFDLLWFFCFLDNLKGDNGDIKDYLKNVNFLYSMYLQDGKSLLFKLENNKMFEVFKND
jgi:hypothetical protein